MNAADWLNPIPPFFFTITRATRRPTPRHFLVQRLRAAFLAIASRFVRVYASKRLLANVGRRNLGADFEISIDANERYNSGGGLTQSGGAYSP
jgi:hypothetical protein